MLITRLPRGLSAAQIAVVVCPVLLIGSLFLLCQLPLVAQSHHSHSHVHSPGGGGGAQAAGESLLVCPEGWHQHSTQCYKFFHQRHSWQRARDICERYGAQLALIHDYQQNNFTTQLASSSLGSGQLLSKQANTNQQLTQSSSLGGSNGNAASLHQLQSHLAKHHQVQYTSDERSYWIGFRAIDKLETNTLESAANTFVSKYIGFWDYEEPRVSQGECVRATVRHELSALAPSSSYKLINSQPQSGKLSVDF